MTHGRPPRFIIVAAILITLGACIGFATVPLQSTAETDRETLFQVSTIDALLQGIYDWQHEF